MPAAAGLTAPLPTELLTPAVLAELAGCAAAADRDGRPDLAATAVLRTTGVLGLAVPREFGGAGAGPVDLNRCVEQVAAVNASAAIMLFQHYAVTSRIVENGTPAQHAEILPKLASGTWLAASAWSETGAGADKKNLATTGRRTADGWVLDGAKSFTTSAGVADIYLVLVQTGSPEAAGGDTAYGAAGQTFFLIRSDNPGLLPDTSLALTGMRGSATGFVSLHECHVTDLDRLGPLGTAASIIARVRESGATLGAVAVGLAQAALDAAFDHARKRGLLELQAVRHRLVDLSTEVETARAIVERAGRRDSEDPGTTTLHSKLFASTTAERVIAEVARLLSSAAYIDASPVNRYGRDARAVALMGPTNDLCRELVSNAWHS
ncbi:acyl-CoA dehydrogenase family protein [Kitasatospora sp. NPDC059571]|uniref:acyl-CoA dehydrogenase family protein n=1 Tax=Kitasatospora sp. NPDC059571 TaxID=3346871 RepID=UPI003679FEE3